MVVPVWDHQLRMLTWCIDQALRAAGGAGLLTHNAKPVTMDQVAGIPVRHSACQDFVAPDSTQGIRLLA